MKLIKLIKDLIKDDKNPRVWERLFVILYLLSLEFVVGAFVGIGVGADAIVVGTVAFAIAIAIAVVISAIAIVISAIAIVGIGIGVVVGAFNPNLIIYLIIAEVIITIIAEVICRKEKVAIKK
jgi:hypothetical protein